MRGNVGYDAAHRTHDESSEISAFRFRCGVYDTGYSSILAGSSSHVTARGALRDSTTAIAVAERDGGRITGNGRTSAISKGISFCSVSGIYDVDLIGGTVDFSTCGINFTPRIRPACAFAHT